MAKLYVGAQPPNGFAQPPQMKPGSATDIIHKPGIHAINLAERYQSETFVIVVETKMFTLVVKFYQ